MLPIIGTRFRALIIGVAMPKNTSISLGDYFDEFISKKIISGRYGSTSEVVRDGLRALEEREQHREALRKALIAGEKSGISGQIDIGTLKSKGRQALQTR